MSRDKKCGIADAQSLQEQLLDWFDGNRRVMPWRAIKGSRPNPYHVWLSEIMLQQTTVAAVGSYFVKFIKKWPTVKTLAAAELDDVLAQWAGLGYYARARNLHKCARAVMQSYNGVFPRTVEGLLELPGIGPYTAAAVASIAFDVPAVAVDGNVERVVSRFCAITDPLPNSKPAIRENAEIIAQGVKRAGDFTQAFMELGATVCTPKKPQCALCPWRGGCKAKKQGIAESLPRKARKIARPVRYGKVFWITDKNGRFLIHKREGRGLYEGLYQLPTTEWGADRAVAASLSSPFHKTLKLKKLDATVRHTFTHFDLVLEIYTGVQKTAAVPKTLPSPQWIYPENMNDFGLPSLMKKAIKLCTGTKS